MYALHGAHCSLCLYGAAYKGAASLVHAMLSSPCAQQSLSQQVFEVTHSDCSIRSTSMEIGVQQSLTLSYALAGTACSDSHMIGLIGNTVHSHWSTSLGPFCTLH